MSNLAFIFYVLAMASVIGAFALNYAYLVFVYAIFAVCAIIMAFATYKEDDDK